MRINDQIPEIGNPVYFGIFFLQEVSSVMICKRPVGRIQMCDCLVPDRLCFRSRVDLRNKSIHLLLRRILNGKELISRISHWAAASFLHIFRQCSVLCLPSKYDSCNQMRVYVVCVYFLLC